jgi:MFS transporter, PAT family, beta-lactamase induction signal transducer AmpG
MIAGIPGLILLYRFVPIGVREPEFKVREPTETKPLTTRVLVQRGIIGGAVGLVLTALVAATLEALSAFGNDSSAVFDLRTPLYGLLAPTELTGWFTTIGIVACGVIAGLLTAAVVAARRGAGRELAEEDPETTTAG